MTTVKHEHGIQFGNEYGDLEVNDLGFGPRTLKDRGFEVYTIDRADGNVEAVFVLTAAQAQDLADHLVLMAENRRTNE